MFPQFLLSAPEYPSGMCGVCNIEYRIITFFHRLVSRMDLFQSTILERQTHSLLLTLSTFIVLFSYYTRYCYIHSTCAAKHTGAVWQVEWVERETVSGEEKSEFLVSSSADGRISQWTIRKGFECTGS